MAKKKTTSTKKTSTKKTSNKKTTDDSYTKNYAPNISQRAVSFIFWGVTAIIFLAIGLQLGKALA